MKRKFFIVIALILQLCWMESTAQEINFGQYYNYTLDVTEVGSEDLSFGQVIRNSGQHTIDITNSKVVALTGVRYLDAIVEITTTDALYLNGNTSYAGDSQKSLPFVLEAAYANNGDNNVAQSQLINVVNNAAVVQFPVLDRQHQPPGPPPTPPTGTFNPASVEETAYIYLYGTVDVGNVDAGSYSTTIEISITYD